MALFFDNNSPVAYSCPPHEVKTMAGKTDKGEKAKVRVKRPTAQKRMLQSEKRAMENRAFRSQVRTVLREFDEAVESKKDDATATLRRIYSLLDKGVKKGVFKLNTASRTKSRLVAKLT